MNPKDWTVIVVEDTYDDRQLASTILAHHGIKVIVAHNGQECLDLLDQVDPTMIITDLAMPEMDGWEMLRQLRAGETTYDIPVVAITAYDSADVANDADRAGFDAYFPKPISPYEFVDSLVALFER
jgi:CheY-like chemotaxis protein